MDKISYRFKYYGYMSEYGSGDNMAPETFDECFNETTATINLKKWMRVFKICCKVLFVFLIIVGVIGAYNSSFVIEKVGNIWQEPVKKFEIGFFIVYLIIYSALMFLAFLFYKLTCAILNCLAQITRNTGISAKLAAFNARNQLMKDASKEKEN